MPDDLLAWAQSLSVPQTPKSSPSDSRAEALRRAADSLGVDAGDLGSIISFETGGTFDPHKTGGEGNRYKGLIQFGPEEQRKYYKPNDTFESQVENGVVSYFKDRFKQAGKDTRGASLEDLYTTVIAGNPNANRNAKDSFGTSAKSGTQRIANEHRPKVLQNFFGGADTRLNPDEVWASIDNVLNPPTDPDAVWGDIENALMPPASEKPLTSPADVGKAPAPTVPAQMPSNLGGSTAQATPPMPESPDTLEYQRQAAHDPNSTRAGVLYTPGSPIPPIMQGETDVQLNDGSILRANIDKFNEFIKGKPTAYNDLKAGRIDFTPLIGGKAVPMNDTSNQTAVVTRDANGKELVASAVGYGANDDVVALEAALQKAQFPNVPTQTRVETAEEVIKGRLPVDDTRPTMEQMPSAPATDEDFKAANDYLASTGKPLLTREQFDAAQNVKTGFQAQATGYQTGAPERQQVTATVAANGEPAQARPPIPAGDDLELEIGLADKPSSQTYTEWVKGKQATGLAEKLGVDYDVAARVLGQLGSPTIGAKSTNQADEEYYAGLVKQGDSNRFVVGGDVVRAIKKAQAAYESSKIKLQAAREKLTAEKKDLDVSPDMLDTMAAMDAGLMPANEGQKRLLQQRNDYIDWLTATGYADEAAVRKAFGEKPSDKPLSAFDWAWYQNPLRALFAHNKGNVPKEIKTSIMNDIQQYGSLAEAVKVYKAQDADRAFSKGIGQPSEAIKTAARYLAKIPSTILETGAVAADANPIDVAYEYITGEKDGTGVKKVLMDAAEGWRNKVDKDLALMQNPAYKKDFIVNELTEGITQFAVQMIGAPLTGGASLAFPLAEGATAQFREADKAGASRPIRLLAATVGAALAAPDVVLKAKYLGALSGATKLKFVENVTTGLFAKFSKLLGEKQAREMTDLTVKSFLKSVAGNTAFGVAGEYTQERLEDVGNKALAKATYKPELTWEDVFVPTEQESRGYWAAGIAGAFGGSVETVIEHMSDKELARAETEITKAAEAGILGQTDLTKWRTAALKEQERRTAKDFAQAPRRTVDLEPLALKVNPEPAKASLTPESKPRIQRLVNDGEIAPSLIEDIPIIAKEGKFSGSLEVPRAEMPQISGDDFAEFKGFAKDSGVEIKSEQIKAGILKPTQRSYNPEHSASLPDEALDKPLTVSSDNRVLDGHNRLVRLLEDGERSVTINRVPLPAKEALALMKEFPKTTYKNLNQVGAMPDNADVPVAEKPASPVDLNQPLVSEGSTEPAEIQGETKNTGSELSKKVTDVAGGEWTVVEDRGDRGVLVQKEDGTKTLLPLDELTPESQATLKNSAELPTHAEFPDSLGIARADMPQVAGRDQTEFQQFATDRGVTISPETIQVKDLKPTQREYNPQQAAQIPLDKVKSKPLMVSSDNRILDGHNTLVKLREAEPDAEIDILRIPLKAKEALALMKEFPKTTFKDVTQIGKTPDAGEAGLKSVPREVEFEGATIPVEPLKLAPELEQVQEKVLTQVAADPGTFVQRYYDEVPNGLKVFNADEAKALFPEYNDDRLIHVASVHEASSIITKLAMQKRMMELPDGSAALAMAGGAASGKTTAASRDIKTADLVFDGVMKNPAKNEQTLLDMQKNGLNPRIVFVFRDPAEAGMLNVMRSEEEQRVVPARTGGNGHFAAAKAFIEHTYQWAKDRGIRVAIYQTRYDQPHRPITIDDLKRLVYNRTEADVIQQFLDGGLKEYEQNKDKYDERIPAALRGEAIAAKQAVDDRGREDGTALQRSGRGSGRGEQGDLQENSRQAAGLVESNPAIQKKIGAGKQAVNGETPPKDKPIVLILGGALNPMHTGHLGAAEDAKAHLEEQGYTVEKVVIAPTPQSLLTAKQDEGKETNAAPLAVRAAIAQATVGDRAEVVQGPSIEAEQATAKLKRTQLADWVAYDNPGRTVVNITGADATVPGAPSTFPGLYSGEQGSSHEGYYYLTMPRDMKAGMSSGQIRAAVKAKEGVPEGAMTPEAERLYLEHLEGTPLKKRSVREADSAVTMIEEPAIPRQGNAQKVVAAIKKQFKRLTSKAIEQMSDAEIVDTIVAHSQAEIDWWLKNSKGYKGFYTGDVKEANKRLKTWAQEVHGRTLSKEEVDLYHLVSAFGSPSADPLMDSSMGLVVFDRYLRTGELTGLTEKQATIWAKVSGKRKDTKRLKFTEEGDPFPSKITRAYQADNLANFDQLTKKFKGTRQEQVKQAVRWLQGEHPRSEIEQMTGKGLQANEYVSLKTGGYGIFGITGTKLGSYFLNRTGNLSTATKDLWYARTMARYFGMPLGSWKVNEDTDKQEFTLLTSPWSDRTLVGRRYRALADQAWQQIAAENGMELAEVQQALWDFEKRLWERLGHPAQDRVFVSQGLEKGIDMAEAIRTGPPLMSATIGAAPLREGTIKKIHGAAQAFGGVAYKRILKLHRNLTQVLKLTVNDLRRTVGVYGATSSNMEASVLPTVTGPAPDVRLYAALMGTLADDVQHSVLISTYKKGGADTEGRVVFKTREAAEGFVVDHNAAGFEDLSYDPATKTVILLDIARFGGQEFAALAEKYDEQIDWDKTEARTAEIEFLGEAEFAGLVTLARGEGHDRGSRGAKLNSLLDQAEAKLRKQGLWPEDGLKSVSRPAQATTPEFKKRFGDSVVVDENGKPLKMYHGGNSYVQEFAADKPAFFTDTAEDAEEFSTSKGGRGRVTEAYLIIKKNGYDRYEALAKEGLPEDEIHQKLQDEGFDGYFDDAHLAVVFSGKNIILADEGSGLKSVTKPFYSQLERAIEQKMPAKATIAQIRGILNSPEIKKEELEWSGLNEWLDDIEAKNAKAVEGKDLHRDAIDGVRLFISKDEVLAFVQENQVEIREVFSGAHKWEGDDLMVNGERVANVVDNEDGTWTYMSDMSDGSDEFATRRAAMNAAIDETVDDPYAEHGPKFDQYVLPGGENYRELLITMPKREWKSFEQWKIDKNGTSEEFIDRSLLEWAYEQEKERAMRGADYQSSHFDEPNILAHVRFDDRTVDGKKTLHISEIQSDWGQSLRKSKALHMVSKPGSVRELFKNRLGGEEIASVPLQQMDGGVLALTDHDQIRRAIVSLLPVDMVDKLGGQERAIKQLFRDSSMVRNAFPANARATVLNGVLDAARSVFTDVRAKLLSGLEAGRDVDLLPTLKASDLTAREVVSLLAPDSLYHLGLPQNAISSDAALARTEDAPAFPEDAQRDIKTLPATDAEFLDTRILARIGTDALRDQSTDLGSKDSPASIAKTLDWHNQIIAQAGTSKPVDYKPTSTPKAMPFSQSWHEMAFKRVLRFAVENGYDAVSWDTGETQNERYDLSKQIDRIHVEKWQDDSRKVNLVPLQGANIEFVVDNAGQVVSGNQGFVGKPLDEVIGKEVAEKILSRSIPATGYFRLAGNDLKIEGTGMIGFYDKMLPTFVNKYTKKWGGKVEAGEIKYAKELAGEGRILIRGKNAVAPAHTVAITPAMRESVMQGQPLFRLIGKEDSRRSEASMQLRRELESEEDIGVVLDGISGGLLHGTTGEWQINEHDAEILRRLMALRTQARTGKAVKESAFDGIVWSPLFMKGLHAFGKSLVPGLKPQVSEKQLRQFNRLLAMLDLAATESKGHQVVFVYEDALPHERTHKEDLDAGRASVNAVRKLTANPLWAGSPRFNEAYGHVSEADRASELAAILANGEAKYYGLDKVPNFEANKDAFLDTWSDGIIETNATLIDQMGFETWAAQYPIITGLYSEALARQGAQSNANNKTDQQGTAESDQKTESPGPAPGSGVQALPQKPPGFTLVDTEEAAGQPDRKTRLASLPETLRSYGIAAVDTAYTVYGDTEATADAVEIFENSGLKGSMQLLSAIKDPDASHTILAGIVYDTLLNRSFDLQGAGAQAARLEADKFLHEFTVRTIKAGRFIRAIQLMQHSPAVTVLKGAETLAEEAGNGLSDDQIQNLGNYARDLEAAFAETQFYKKEAELLRKEMAELDARLTEALTTKQRARATAGRRRIYNRVQAKFGAEIAAAMAKAERMADESNGLLSPAHHGTPHVFKAEILIEKDGKREFIVGDIDQLPEVPKGATVVKKFPHGRMRLNAIGSGEGHAAYGHGLYFASQEKVADWYRQQLSKGGTFTYDGKEWSPGIVAWTDYSGKDRALDVVRTAAQRNGGAFTQEQWEDIEEGLSEEVVQANMGMRGNMIDKYPALAARRNVAQKTLDAFRELDRTKVAYKPGGARYNVDLKPAEDEYLDLDKGYSEQSQKVKDALGTPEEFIEKVGGTISVYDTSTGPVSGEDVMDWKGIPEAEQDEIWRNLSPFQRDAGIKEFRMAHKNAKEAEIVLNNLHYRGVGQSRDEAVLHALREVNGRVIYNLITRLAIRSLNYGKPSQEFASNWLLEKGIRGNRYLDGDSRHRGKQDHNFVIFSDKDVAIESVLKSVAYQGSPRPFNKEVLIRDANGNEVYLEGTPDKMPKVPKSSTVIKEFPHGRHRTSKIGTGEGNAAYGYGHYFAEAEAVSKFYESTLAKAQNQISYKGKPVRDIGLMEFNLTPEEYAWKRLQDEIRRSPLAANNWVRNAKFTALHVNGGGEPSAHQKAAAEILDKIDPSKITFAKGVKYKVDLKPKDDEYLLWDKPIAEQSDKVRPVMEDLIERFNKVPKKYRKTEDKWDEMRDLDPIVDGASFYRALKALQDYPYYPGIDAIRKVFPEFSNYAPYGKGVSNLLLSKGVRGNKYLDGDSRSGGEGSFNYVIFNENDVEIEEVLKSVSQDPTGQQRREFVDLLGTIGAGHLAKGLAEDTPYMPETLKAVLEAQFGSDVISPIWDDVYAKAVEVRDGWLQSIAMENNRAKASRRREDAEFEKNLEKTLGRKLPEKLTDKDVLDILGVSRDITRRQRAIEKMHRYASGVRKAAVPLELRQMILGLSETELEAVAAQMVAENVPPAKIYDVLEDLANSETRGPTLFPDGYSLKAAKEAFARGKEIVDQAKQEVKDHRAAVAQETAAKSEMVKDAELAEIKARERLQATKGYIADEYDKVRNPKSHFAKKAYTTTVDLLRNLTLSAEMSFLRRQGGKYIRSEAATWPMRRFRGQDPGTTRPPGREAIKTALPGGDRAYATNVKAIENHYLYPEAVKMGVDFSTAGKLGTSQHVGEEQLQSEAIDRMVEFLNKSALTRYTIALWPKMIQRFDKSMAVFLDNLRMRLYERLSNTLRDKGFDPKKDRGEFEELARRINTGTARPNKLANKTIQGGIDFAVNTKAFLAPSYTVAKWQDLGADTRNVAVATVKAVTLQGLPKGTQKIMIERAVASYAALVAEYALWASLIGALVSFDPDDDDFLKLKVGHYRYDLTQGNRAELRYIGRLVKHYDEPRKVLDLQLGYLRTRLNVLPGFAVNAYTEKDVAGKDFDLKDPLRWLGLIAPMAYMNAIGAAKEAGPFGVGATLPFDWIGIPASVYPDRVKDINISIKAAKAKGDKAEVERLEKEKVIQQRTEAEQKRKDTKKRLEDKPFNETSEGKKASTDDMVSYIEIAREQGRSTADMERILHKKVENAQKAETFTAEEAARVNQLLGTRYLPRERAKK